MNWVIEHPRLTIIMSLFLICGVLAVFGQYAASLLLLPFPLRAIWHSIAHPESEAAIQQDARDRRKTDLADRFMECLEWGGVEVLEDEQFECVSDDPLCFRYYPMAYGTNKKKLADIAEASLPIFGAIRSRVDLLPKNDTGFYGYGITLHDKTELEALMGMTVEYADIASDDPTNEMIPIGKFEDGTTASISLEGKAGALLAGLPRSGKSVLLNSIIASLSKCGSQRIVVCSSKTLDFVEFSQRAELYQEPEDILQVMQEISEEVERRKIYCATHGLKRITKFSSTMPHIVVLFDEFAVIKASVIPDPSGKKARRIGCEIEEEAFKLVSQGAFAGVFTLITSQRLSTNVVSGDLRSLLAGGVLISFASGDQNSDTMLFGSKSAEAAACEIPVMAKGIGYLYCEGDMDSPQMFKSAMLSPEEEKRIARETENLKPKGKSDGRKANQNVPL